MSSTQQQQNQASALKLMDDAQRLRVTDPSAAIGIYRSLKGTPNFPYQAHCGQQYAIGLLQTGQLEAALKEFEAQISSVKDKNTIRGLNLRFAAETAIALGKFDSKVDTWLKEAQQIFETNQDLQYVGQVMRLRGIVEAQNGDMVAGQQHIEEGTRIAEAYRTNTSTVETTRTSSPQLTGVSAY